MDVRPFSRRQFVGGVAATIGALSLRPEAELLAQGQTAQFSGGDAEYDAYVKLASNENNYGPPPSVMKAMNDAWKYANRYGYPDGNINQVIADHHGVKRENILLTAGSGEGLNVMATTYLKPGQKVLGVSPSYASVFQQAANVKADSIQIPLTKDYRQNISQMIEVTNRYARDIGFVYMCNPNNPTGAVVTAKEIKDLLDNIPKDMPVLIDEAYHHFVDDPAYATSLPYVLEGRPVIITRTFSKISGLAGMRLGYAVASAEFVNRMRPFTTGTISAVVKWGGVAALKDTAAQARVKRMTIDLRRKATTELQALGYPSIPSECNFFMTHIRRPVVPVIEEFRKRGVLVGRPFPPMLEHLRVSIGTVDEMRRFMVAFKDIMAVRTTSGS